MQTKIEESTKANGDLTDVSAAFEVFLCICVPRACSRRTNITIALSSREIVKIVQASWNHFKNLNVRSSVPTRERLCVVIIYLELEHERYEDCQPQQG